MKICDAVLDYVATKVLYDFKNNLLTNELANLFSSRPWIDAIRDKADMTCLEQIQRALDNPNKNTGITNLALNIARGIDCSKIISSIRTTFRNSSNLAMKISAMLLLAAYGEMEGKWDTELAKIGEDKEGLIQTAMTFYGCDSVEGLLQAVRQRLSSRKYACNRPYYEYICQIIEKSR